jgi:hypothetical protein
VRNTLLLLLSVLVLSACAPAADLEAAKRQIAALQSQVSSLQAENEHLKNQLAKKPDLPITIAFRRALMGPGYVAVFNTTVKSPVSVLVALTSADLGTTKRFELHLNASTATELGHMQGAVIENGDTITVENANYSSTTIIVAAK